MSTYPITKQTKTNKKNVKTHFCNMVQLCTKLKNKIYFTTKSSVIYSYIFVQVILVLKSSEQGIGIGSTKGSKSPNSLKFLI